MINLPRPILYKLQGGVTEEEFTNILSNYLDFPFNVKQSLLEESSVSTRLDILKKSLINTKIDEEIENDLNKVVTKLFALAESYPELKADTNFRELQTTLTETEDKISYARQFYNDVVMKYNNKVEVFPSNIVAGMFGFKTSAYFNATEEERENVKVKF